MSKKPFPFKVCEQCCSGESGGNNITVDSELSLTSKNPVQNKVVAEKFKNIEPFVVNVAFSKVGDGEYEYLDIKKWNGETADTWEERELNQLGYLIIEAYKTGKQILLKLIDASNPRNVYYSAMCDWWEHGIIRWHVHMGDKCFVVLFAAMEQDDDYHAFWQIYPLDNATKQYVDTAIGDIETSLENIITKYGLGGDSV